MKLYSVIYHKLVSLPSLLFLSQTIKSILTTSFIKDNPIVEVLESPETIKVSTLRHECAIALNDLDPDACSSFSYEDGFWVTLKTPYSNIQVFASALRELTSIIKFQEQIPVDEINKEYIDVTLDRFLLNKDGYYQDVRAAVSEFRKAGLSLCKAMEPSDAATHGVYEYNRRMLTKLFLCIKNITKTLEFQ